jgi:hypothetical protein
MQTLVTSMWRPATGMRDRYCLIRCLFERANCSGVKKCLRTKAYPALLCKSLYLGI